VIDPAIADNAPAPISITSSPADANTRQNGLRESISGS